MARRRRRYTPTIDLFHHDQRPGDTSIKDDRMHFGFGAERDNAALAFTYNKWRQMLANEGYDETYPDPYFVFWAGRIKPEKILSLHSGTAVPREYINFIEQTWRGVANIGEVFNRVTMPPAFVFDNLLTCEVTHDDYHQAMRWCEDNDIRILFDRYNLMRFTNEDDATLFKLRFG